MAFPSFDPAKHARGFHGRFAPGGDGVALQRFRLGPVARMRTDRGGIVEDLRAGNRGYGATRPRRSEGAARRRYKAITGRGREVTQAYAAVARGTSTWPQQSMTEYASPSARDKARAATGSVMRPKSETMRIQTSLLRGGRTPRKETKRTFGGKTVAVRGYGREYTTAAGYVATSRRVRNFAGTKRART